jgi:hypothetical protein
MSRRGFALPAVLFGLLLLAAVVIGAWVAAWQSVRHSRLAESEARLRLRVSADLARQVALWDATVDSLAAGAQTVAAGGVAITRTGPNTFMLTASVADSLLGSRQTLRDFVRLRPVVLAPAAAVRLQFDPGPLGSRISGRDSVPPGWSCATVTDSITTLTIQLSDSTASGPAIGGSWTRQKLAAWIQSLPPGGDSLGWRYVAGDTTLAGGRYVGLLMAEGNVTLRSGAVVVGLVISRGAIVFEGLGGAIFGQVVARTLELSAGTVAGAAAVSYSGCAAAAAGRSRAPVRPFPGVPPSDVH